MDVKKNVWFVLCVLSICFTLKHHLSSAARDSISANQSLSGDQTIVSAGGVFELGFFKPGNSSNYYIGIWYKKLPEQTIVWVANREKPVPDKNSSVLRISDGNLVLLNESKKPIWSTSLNASNTTASIEAVVLDEGNLVLRDSSANSTLWQSFDHPTHTWLPGMKFGINKRAKVNQFLISWKNKEDPAPGLFSLELAPDGSDQYVIMWNRSEQYWNSGVWTGINFANVPEMISRQYVDFNYISDENGRYFVYSVTNSMTMRFVIDSSGQIEVMFWLESSKAWFQFWSQPRQPCDVYAYCGAFGSCNEGNQSFCACLPGFRPKWENNWNLMQDYSSGCVRKTQLQCENTVVTNGKSDKFLANSHMVLPKHPQSVAVGSIKECETTCSRNCSCTAYAYEDNACSIWIGSLLSLHQLSPGDANGKTIYVKLAASEFSSSSNNKGIVIGAVVGSVAFVAILGLLAFMYFRKRENTMKTSKSVEDGSLVAFAYKDLLTATKNFSEKLGGGGFGSVFKGRLPNSSVIAVKKLDSFSQGEKQFRAEVSTIGNIQHVNLVRLRGFCSEGTKKLLVYDYMPNGSLDSHIFHRENSKVLDWKTRYQIALGTARGLAYLHEKCRDCIIHCDIKPENILLDAQWCPKVADFGMSKLVGREFSRVLTTIRGTRGYLAPEWLSGVAITAKADVYSYGMMLFEIVSGRRNFEWNSVYSEDEEMKYFPTWAASLMSEGGNVLSLLDKSLEGSADVEELSRICKVACWCIQDDETHRPSMGQVVQILEGVLEVTQSPIPRSLKVIADNKEDIIFFTESSETSAASSQAKFAGSSASS
ncbi:G-type lectin S-receptor-like serine/threonine-protein kinase [Citrus sinensis]|uniref:G-type lectin S-receptor-like serine/threonine-protein kinase n=1 Tax=Citrus sinensis TaxID=2711 RepID=A0ACB8N3Y5_CITSI|nr:G-type lectin S-receptor-like serine/threonine-protein kinase [Citrus sinensis]